MPAKLTPEEAREHRREAKLRWYWANAERIRADSLAAVRRSREANPEPSRAAARRWSAKHPAKMVAITAKRRALKRRATVGDPKAIAAVYEKARSLRRVRCTYCGKYPKVGERHVDHVIPLARGGAHSAENLRIACACCNLRKRTKTAEEFRTCQR